jgi:NOL1/NOP2/sun family putative RNA methylase
MTCIFPEAFCRRGEALFADEWPTVCAGLSAERATSFRINTLLADSDAVTGRLIGEGFSLSPVQWVPNAYSVPPGQRRALTESASFEEGHIYIQNPASMLPPMLLAPEPGDRVLDLAAAPGSKTLQLAAMMGNRGWISAVEPVKTRFFRLKRNLRHHGAENVHTYMKDGARVWRHVPEHFERVLLDAPCSSEGQFLAQVPQTWAYWSEKKVKEMARKQKRLLYSAIQCLKPGGRLVYSTCTLSPEENEAVVDAMLRKFSGKLEVLTADIVPPQAIPGLRVWRGKSFHGSLDRALRILPGEVTEGFFACVLVKTASTLSP